jgi:hypothetical protein
MNLEDKVQQPLQGEDDIPLRIDMIALKLELLLEMEKIKKVLNHRMTNIENHLATVHRSLEEYASLIRKNNKELNNE